LFREISGENNVSLDKSTIGYIRSRVDSTESRIKELKAAYNLQLSDITNSQRSIADPIMAKWPAILGPYTAGYQELIANGTLTVISDEIAAHPAYPILMRGQKQLLSLETLLMNAQRDLTQMQKLLHLRRIATLKQQLMDFGTKEEIETYNQFLRCEEAPLSSQPTVQLSETD